MSLTALPTEVQIVIVGHLATTLEQPMDDLRSLWVTCSSMRRICGDPTVGQRLALDQSRAPDSIPKLLPSILLHHRRLLPGLWRSE
jgi:hypothetical protein